MHDRLPDIKASCHARVYGPAVSDVSWLIAEVERLRNQIESIRAYLSEALGGHHSSSILTLLDSVLHQRRGAMTELAEIHDILAEALGYRQDALDDPNSPCPGAWVTGDHTAASLALEAAKTLARRKDSIAALGRALDRANTALAETVQKTHDLRNQLSNAQKRLDINNEARKNYEQAITNAVNQIVELQHELAEVRDTKKGQLRRELAARKENCCCVFQDEGLDESRLLPHPDCREHGIEANDRRLAGEKAVSTLQYVRKYFMGSEHGHGV